MLRSRVVLLSWIVAAAFFLAVVLRFVDQLNLVATPPVLDDNTNMVQRSIATAGYRQAIWPVFLWTNALFALGFVALVAFAGAAVGSVGRTLAVFAALTTVGGVIGAVAGVIPIGAVDTAVWLGYCDCGFRDQEIVSQIWATMVTSDIGNWLTRAAGLTLAAAVITLLRDGQAFVTPGFRIWSYVTAIALVAAPVLGILALSVDATDLLTAAIAGILVPVWVVWLGRSIDRGAAVAPA